MFPLIRITFIVPASDWFACKLMETAQSSQTNENADSDGMVELIHYVIITDVLANSLRMTSDQKERSLGETLETAHAHTHHLRKVT